MERWLSSASKREYKKKQPDRMLRVIVQRWYMWA